MGSYVGAVLIGLAAAFVLIIAVEFLSSIVHPTDIEACRAHVARYPAWVLAVVVPAWGLTTFVSVWLATRLGSGRHRAHGYVVGAILLALVICNISMLTYPIWFCAANLIVFPLAIYWGRALLHRSPQMRAKAAVESVRLLVSPFFVFRVFVISDPVNAGLAIVRKAGRFFRVST
jgi:hypothetical protein